MGVTSESALTPLHKAAVFMRTERLIFTKPLKMNSLTSKTYIAALKLIRKGVKLDIWSKLCVLRPQQTPWSKSFFFFFLPALSHFSTDILKEGIKIAQLLNISWDPKLFETLTIFCPCIHVAHHYFKTFL